MLLKNAIQKVHVYAYNSTTGAAKTNDAAQITGYVSLDGTANAIDDTNPAEVDATNLPGVYVFDLTAAETNCDAWALYAKSSTADIRIEPIIGFTTAGTATALTANAAYIGGTAQAGRDLGTSVLLAPDQAVNATKWAGTAIDAESIPVATHAGAAGGLPTVPVATVTGAVAAGTLTATAFTTNLGAYGTGYWKDALVLFTSGVLIGQVKKIGAFATTTGLITLAGDETFTAAPSAADTFIIVNR